MKRISPATVTVGVFAVLIGLVAAYSVKRYLQPAAKPGEPQVSIVVPRINLPRYARIREQDVDVVEMPVRKAPPAALTSASLAIHRLVRNTIMAGQPIVDPDLYEVGKVPTLAEQLPPGQRAVTIAVDANNALDGVLLPESLVDISLTVRGEHPDLGGVSTLTLLRRVMVLATNRDRFPTEERLNQPLRSITVAVTPEQANKLILAQRFGTLSLTLRGTLDDEQLAQRDETSDDRVNPAALLGLSPVPQRVVKKAQIWRGDSMQEVTFSAEQIREAREASVAEQPQPGGVLPTGYRRELQPAPLAEPQARDDRSRTQPAKT